MRSNSSHVWQIRNGKNTVQQGLPGYVRKGVVKLGRNLMYGRYIQRRRVAGYYYYLGITKLTMKVVKHANKVSI